MPALTLTSQIKLERWREMERWREGGKKKRSVKTRVRELERERARERERERERWMIKPVIGETKREAENGEIKIKCLYLEEKYERDTGSNFPQKIVTK